MNIRERLSKRWDRFIDWYNYCREPNRKVILVTLAAGIPLFLISSFLILIDNNILNGIVTEGLGIIFTVFIVDRYSRIHSEKAEIDSLIRRVGSTSNETAKAAIDELKKLGWLEHGILRAADLRNADLENADFTGYSIEDNVHRVVDLSEANFSKAKLNGANLEGLILSNANFEDALLERANLKKTKLTNAKFIGAKMTEVELAGSSLDYTNFTDAILNDAYLTEPETYDQKARNLHLAIFGKTRLQRIDFTVYEDLEGVNFIEMDLTGANFTGVNLSHADFTSAILVETIFEDANLTGVNLSNAKCSQTNFDKATLLKATINSDTSFTGSRLRGANFDKAIIKILSESDQEIIPGLFTDTVEVDEETILPDGQIWTKENMKNYRQALLQIPEEIQLSKSPLAGKSVSNEIDEYED